MASSFGSTPGIGGDMKKNSSLPFSDLSSYGYSDARNEGSKSSLEYQIALFELRRFVMMRERNNYIQFQVPSWNM